jgi:hypothetical protein
MNSSATLIQIDLKFHLPAGPCFPTDLGGHVFEALRSSESLLRDLLELLTTGVLPASRLSWRLGDWSCMMEIVKDNYLQMVASWDQDVASPARATLLSSGDGTSGIE